MKTHYSKGRFWVSLAILAFSGIGTNSVLAGDRWEFASIVPPDYFAARIAQEFANSVSETTNGNVSVALHLSGALGLKGGLSR